MANHSVSHPLRTWRLASKLTLRQAGDLIGVHGAAFGKYEQGIRYPRPAILVEILRVTDGAVTANDFLPSEPLRAAE